jgi:hypothetical protein
MAHLGPSAGAGARWGHLRGWRPLGALQHPNGPPGGGFLPSRHCGFPHPQWLTSSRPSWLNAGTQSTHTLRAAYVTAFFSRLYPSFPIRPLLHHLPAPKQARVALFFPWFLGCFFQVPSLFPFFLLKILNFSRTSHLADIPSKPPSTTAIPLTKNWRAKTALFA